MSLIEERITEKGVIKYDKVAVAIQTLKDYEQIACSKTDTSGESGYYVCISGGKDSSVIQQLCIMAGVKCVFHHNHTGLDHPETVRFIRREKARLEELGYEFEVDMPAETIWSLIRKKGMLPTRLVKYKAMWMRACEYLVSTPLSRCKTAQELYDWWTEKYKKIEIDENQLSLIDDEE